MPALTPKPLIALTTTVRVADTYLGPKTRLHGLGTYYTEAVRDTGAAIVAVPEMEPGDAPLLLHGADGLLITGGHDIDPALYGQDNTASVDLDRTDDDRDIALVLEARRRRIPTLAICRGIQVLNVALGGTLHQHILDEDHPEHPLMSESPEIRNAHRHMVHLEPDSRLADIYATDRRRVNSLHHQAVDRAGDGLRVTGKTPGGHIEAMESADPKWPALAVQWHPEMLNDAEEQALFGAFAEDARLYRLRRRGMGYRTGS